MSYLHELKELEREIEYSFVVRYYKFKDLLLVISLILSVLSYNVASIHFHIIFPAVAFLLLAVWFIFSRIYAARHNKLLEIKNEIFGVNEILGYISNKKFNEVSNSFFASSNNVIYDDIFDNVSKFYIRRDDERIYIKYIIGTTEYKIYPFSIKYAQQHKLFTF